MSKYGNRKTEWNGVEYDSAKEARRAAELRLMQMAGIISDLREQVKFELIPAQRRGKHTERAVNYIADFVYTENGETVVEDVKGFRTKEFIVKRKLMLWEFGIVVKEV